MVLTGVFISGRGVVDGFLNIRWGVIDGVFNFKVD